QLPLPSQNQRKNSQRTLRCSCPVPLALSPAACMLCRRAEADPDMCGDKLQKGGLCAHVFCMVSGSGQNHHVGLMGFLPRDLLIAVWRAAQKGQAMRAGLLYFQCPLCRDSEEFPVEMFVMGIRVPFRQPTWEDNNAFAELAERHSQCNARECLYPGGREEAEEEGPWELLLCSSCAAEGTHRRCSGLKNRIDRWECDTCAGTLPQMTIWDLCLRTTQVRS
uniref:PHF7/G2E3-like PHD zinc finger domain-containing protein n=1 Tax=Geospiza parvula TaxID=87175 RepID=A0A8U8BNK4_GEOPR